MLGSFFSIELMIGFRGIAFRRKLKLLGTFENGRSTAFKLNVSTEWQLIKANEAISQKPFLAELFVTEGLHEAQGQQEAFELFRLFNAGLELIKGLDIPVACRGWRPFQAESAPAASPPEPEENTLMQQRTVRGIENGVPLKKAIRPRSAAVLQAVANTLHVLNGELDLDFQTHGPTS